MTNQNALGELRVDDEQIHVAATAKVTKQIRFIPQHDRIGQLAQALRQCGFRNRIDGRRCDVHVSRLSVAPRTRRT